MARLLSSIAESVLQMIANGCSYEQILRAHPDITYLDIFASAEEALELLSAKSHEQRLALIKQSHPRAYEPWSDEEDAQLSQMVSHGIAVQDIADQLQRQPSAIRSRMDKRVNGQRNTDRAQ